MGSGIFRGARWGAVALIGFSGFLASCNTTGIHFASGGGARAAVPASATIEVSDNFGVVELEKNFEDVSRRVAPSVVAISATETTVDADSALRAEELNSERLAALLNSVDRTVGTGFIVDADGYIVTNDHVVAHARQLWVTTDDHRIFPAIVLASDPRADIAVLKVPAAHLPVVHFGQSRSVHRGQWTIALGNPYGYSAAGEMSASVGVVSAVGRSLPKLSSKEDRLYSDLIQTTAQINPGNSGGPLFDLHGNVIGINTAVILPQKQTNGIGFAMPITPRLLQIIDRLKQGREIVYGYLGVKVVSPTGRERREAGIGDDGGARIESMDDGSPADGELKSGDIIVCFNGQIVQDGDHFVRLVGEASVGTPVHAVICRGGKTLTVGLKLRRREVSGSIVTRDSQRLRWRGLLLGSIPAHWDLAGIRPKSGLIVLSIDPRSPLIKEGMRQGAVITAVAGRQVTEVTDLQRILNDIPVESCLVQWSQPGNQLVSAGD